MFEKSNSLMYSEDLSAPLKCCIINLKKASKCLFGFAQLTKILFSTVSLTNAEVKIIQNMEMGKGGPSVQLICRRNL